MACTLRFLPSFTLTAVSQTLATTAIYKLIPILLVPGGSGAHTNISLHEIRESGATTARNQLPTRSDDALAPTLTLAERSFLSGVLAHTPALCALTLPTAASYARVADGAWSGGTYTVWGSDNREAVVRVTGPRVRGRTRFEVRFVDGTACPHVALAGLLAAGINAVNQGRVLATGDCQQPVPLMNMEEKRALGVCDADGELLVGRLPRTIAQARKNLANDLELHETLGAVFVKNYLSVNEVSFAAKFRTTLLSRFLDSRNTSARQQ